VVDFMNNNSIAYNTNVETRCVGSIYYLINFINLADKIKKSSIAEMLNIYQSTMMGVFNVLCSPDCQSMIPDEYRLNSR
jgi:hypothetical protein